ncbi:putative serine threonine-protein kinase bur1 protein [Botrytis fragariae]|uniref:cyclin-dependent kinase n=1 Tax=Botrytis fragariae TaxID=1964551 RepID=A0A8H6EG18_9HELO|nr:putative serine threonine-protein kinase bur1 protein [Botrytis fragariae]KAF5870947.1 putative serine threonine-protein kinase bur1 protein [Botrytis fragariae]
MPSTPQPKEHPPARDAIALEMKDSWSPGDDRRDRGRVDRGVIERRSRRSRSPTSRRPDADRTPNTRDRSTDRSRPTQEIEKPDRSPDRRRLSSPRPSKDTQEDVLKRNQGRELLLETRGSEIVRGNTAHSPQQLKRRKSRSPSPSRNQQKKIRRNSRSPVRHNGATKGSRRDRKRRNRSTSQHRHRQPEPNRNNQREEGNPRNRRDFGKNDKRGRSPGQNRDKFEKSRPSSALDYDDPPTNRNKSPNKIVELEQKEGGNPAPNLSENKERKREASPYSSHRSPEADTYEHKNRGRRQSPRAPKGPKGNRRRSPKREKGRPSRDEYRPNNKSRGRPTSAASGANSIEVKSDKMANRGFYGNQQGYNPNQQMQAAFPLKPQFNQVPQGPQADPRQFSQSPQHQMTPNSYHGSPQAQSPYSSGRGNWNGSQQQQFSPSSQFQQNYQQQPGYATPTGPQSQMYGNQAQSPSHQGPPTGPMNNNFRGNQRNFRANNFNPRGNRGNQFNPQWNPPSGPSGASRAQFTNSGNVTPQQMSPQQQFPQQNSFDSGAISMQDQVDESEDLFRPSKDLQAEDTSKKNDEQMLPPSRPPPTGPQSQQNSSKFSFAFKGPAKAATTPKPEISQKLNAVPIKRDMQNSPRGPAATRNIPTEPASARAQHAFREPPPPVTRKVKKIMQRLKPKPQLLPEYKASDSVYYRKPGNESVVGSGTYGKVFKAIHVYTKKLVALKKIRLDYLHRRGVLHRDIKAANILVSDEGQLKLADFGLARFYAKRRQLDYTNRVITIWYRSPELLLGETQYGPAVDIWSAACVLVEIFTRHAIFPGDGGEISQLEKIYAVLGTPNRNDWPGLVDMAWFELLRPSAKRSNVFAEKYKERVTPAAFELLDAMFQYDPAKRPSASDVLEHPYFTTEEPTARQAIELKELKGDWHEFESKALRKENERKDKEARRAAQKEKEKKRTAESEACSERDSKRVMMAPPDIPPPSAIPKTQEVTASSN